MKFELVLAILSLSISSTICGPVVGVDADAEGVSTGSGVQEVFVPALVKATSLGKDHSGVGDDEDRPSPGWVDPRINNGSMLSFVRKHKGEPLNVIISGNSDPSVLTDEGLRAYSKSIGFSSECFGLHAGGFQSANLGDGMGQVDEQYLARQSYFDTVYGPCWESFIGGQHFRAWRQNGTEAATGAWFLAASQELFIGKRHMIAPDGYNRGRDWLVERAVKGGSWEDDYWIAEVEWVEGLIEPGFEGINHEIAQDGRVAVLTVTKTLQVSRGGKPLIVLSSLILFSLLSMLRIV